MKQESIIKVLKKLKVIKYLAKESRVEYELCDLKNQAIGCQ